MYISESGVLHKIPLPLSSMCPEVERLGLIERKTGYFEVLDSGYVPFRGENMCDFLLVNYDLFMLMNTGHSVSY